MVVWGSRYMYFFLNANVLEILLCFQILLHKIPENMTAKPELA